MKHYAAIIALGCTFVLVLGYTFRKNERKPERIIEDQLMSQIDSFRDIVALQLLPAVRNPDPDPAKLQQLFIRSRLAYKKFEWAAEYFTPGSNRLINGPPVPEVEKSGITKNPTGLQIIEPYLFPEYDPLNQKEVISNLEKLLAAAEQTKIYFRHITVFNWQVWEASRFEVFRVLSLGLTGFDCPLSRSAVTESAVALQSLELVLRQYTDQNSISLQSSVSYLKAHKDFDSFDRAYFISRLGNPLSSELLHQQKELKITPMHYNRLLRQDAPTLFSPGAFNVMAFAADPQERLDKQKIALGEKLFNDPLLSGPMTRSCASCHQPDKSFSDGQITNTDIQTSLPLARRTPTLINAALQPAQFADMRVSTLEDQIADVLNNKREMHSSLALAASRLSKSTNYQNLFNAVYPGFSKNQVNATEVASALSAYVRSLVSLNSRFDEYMRGDKNALQEQEIEGFNLFMGKAKCGTCHYMPLFNGTLPPLFERMDAEVVGTPNKNRLLDTDMGQFRIIAAPSLVHAFKTPTVRNTARQAYYMHNGVFRNLEEVMDFYKRAGGAGEGLNVPNQTLSDKPLHLSKADCNAIIVFIGSLSSTPGNPFNY